MNQLLQFAAAEGPHVSIKPSEIFSIGGFPITNSILLGLLGFAIVFWMMWHTASVIKHNRKRTFVAKLVEWIYESLYNAVASVIPDEKVARAVAPVPITLFFFILVQYYLGVLPIVGPLFYNGHHLFRSYVADMNTTFGLAFVTLIAIEVYAFKVHGIFGGLSRYFKNPIKDFPGAFEGILEIIAQMSRGIALSMRLFGNVFAGEVLLIMIAFLTQYAGSVALPVFYLFEIFIGGIQAYIFFMLTNCVKITSTASTWPTTNSSQALSKIACSSPPSSWSAMLS
jgi:F-type H+-transporting ATPase subunit a